MADDFMPPDGSGETQDFDPELAREDPLLGQVVDNFHVLGVIGTGGHGTVYRARDIRLGRTVALKVLRYPRDVTARKAMLREARTLAQLEEHPGIVQVFVWGELTDNAYFALEYFESNGADLIREHPEGVVCERALLIARDCAEALAHAHKHGILHLDIKPANILMDGDGARVKLCDFGLAQFYEEDIEEQAGVSGSPAFMSPEQIRGETLGPASDLFSLGVTIYQLLSGHLPFEGVTVSDTTHAILSGKTTSIHTYLPRLDPEIASIVERCLATDAASRFASADELSAAIDALNTHATLQRRAPSRSPVRTLTVFAAALLAVVLGAVIMPMLGGRSGDEDRLADAAGEIALESGDFAKASNAYKALLEQNPEDDRLRYGLGYSQLLGGRLSEAEATFSAMKNHTLAEEGQTAVAQHRNGGADRATLESFLERGGSPYGNVMVAAADMVERNYAAARGRLVSLDDGGLEFDWQRARLWQTLGQAHFKLGELTEARTVFGRLARLKSNPASQTAADYLELTKGELAREDYERLSAQIARVSALRNKPVTGDLDDRWSSRRIRLWIPPATSQRSVYAVESGIVDVLPWKLSKTLNDQEDFPIDVVDRNYSAALLSEQELSAQLSSPDDAVQLGALLGARLALFCKFTEVLGEESLTATLVDVETSRATPLEEVPLNGVVNLDAWIEQIGDEVVFAIRRAYPLRGIIRDDGGTKTINIGKAHGLKSGMRFMLMSGPGRKFDTPGIIGIVREPVTDESAAIQLENESGPAIPAEGWYGEVLTEMPGDGNA